MGLFYQPIDIEHINNKRATSSILLTNISGHLQQYNAIKIAKHQTGFNEFGALKTLILFVF